MPNRDKTTNSWNLRLIPSKGKGWLIGGILSLVILLGGQTAAFAVTSGYSSNDTQLKPGMAVSLSQDTSGDTALVERARASQSDKFIGVAVSMSDSLLTVASSDAQIYVSTSGEVEAYVVDLNGDIAKGDSVTLSPLRGIFMKATQTTDNIVGVALEDFSGKTTESVNVQDGDQTLTTNLAKIKLNIDARVATTTQKGTSYFERLGKAISGKNISELQILTAFIIFLVLLVVEGSLMYGAISSLITSLGRNPLSRALVYKAFMRSVLVALGILAVGGGAIYLVLVL